MSRLCPIQYPVEKHGPFLVGLWAHDASYLAGFVGGIIVIISTWRADV
jgi:hypothetical protein